jgi:hypothetical protein
MFREKVAGSLVRVIREELAVQVRYGSAYSRFLKENGLNIELISAVEGEPPIYRIEGTTNGHPLGYAQEGW